MKEIQGSSAASSSLILALCIGLAPECRAVEYHVAPSGDDANPGTAVEPWQTLEKANMTMQAGDTVWSQSIP